MDSQINSINTQEETVTKKENAQLPPTVNNNLREKLCEIEPELYVSITNLYIQ